ncbi:hypothetical protein ACLKA7_006167 [Drosophila subpalustris]
MERSQLMNDNGANTNNNLITYREALRVRFLRNNHVQFEGISLTVSRREHRTFEKLLESVTRALNKCPSVRLPTAVCELRRLDGARITCVSQLLDTKINFNHNNNNNESTEILGSNPPTVIACCQHEKFRCLDYKALQASSSTSTMPLTLDQAPVNRSYIRINRTVCPSSMYDNMPLAMLIPRTLRNTYTTGHRLHSGHSGAVIVLRHAVTRQRLVLKVMELKSRDQRELNEIRILQKLQGHPHIINLMFTEITSRAIYIVVEAMDMDLMDFKKSLRHLTASQATYVMRKIVKGLAYIHSMDIVHRDIKLDNILVRLDGRSPIYVTEVKIADFGLAANCKEDQVLYSVVGTERFIAPEMLSGNGYNKLVDCYSAGVTFHMLTTNSYPIENNGIEKTVIARFTNWSNCCDLISHMLQIDPSQRWSAAELMEHQFLTAHCWLDATE